MITMTYNKVNNNNNTCTGRHGRSNGNIDNIDNKGGRNDLVLDNDDSLIDR